MDIIEFHIRAITAISHLLEEAIVELDADSQAVDIYIVREMTDLLCQLIRDVKNC